MKACKKFRFQLSKYYMHANNMPSYKIFPLQTEHLPWSTGWFKRFSLLHSSPSEQHFPLQSTVYPCASLVMHSPMSPLLYASQKDFLTHPLRILFITSSPFSNFASAWKQTWFSAQFTAVLLFWQSSYEASLEQDEHFKDKPAIIKTKRNSC